MQNLMFYKPERGFDGYLEADKEKIMVDDLVVHFSELYRFMKILMNHGVKGRKELIAIERMIVHRNCIEKLVNTRPFKGCFNCGVEDFGGVVCKGVIKLGAIAFNIDGCNIESITGDQVEIKGTQMAIYKTGECILDICE